LYLATIVGGTQGIRAEIRLINSNTIRVNYTIFDTFGAGDTDAGRPHPGLKQMYVLQHYRNKNNNLYQPFFLQININR
jgi:hypothetical protein